MSTQIPHHADPQQNELAQWYFNFQRKIEPHTNKIILAIILGTMALVAYQVFAAMNGTENASKAGEHLGRFEMICSDAETRDQATTSLVQTHSKLEDRGFV